MFWLIFAVSVLFILDNYTYSNQTFKVQPVIIMRSYHLLEI
jgi:hypothetical protein